MAERILIAAGFASLIFVGADIPFSELTRLRPVIIISGSMEPTLKNGSLALIEKLTQAEADKLSKGDVITFIDPRQSTRWITHRIAATRPNGRGRLYITKGDANEALDVELVQASAIIGKVRTAVPYLGYVVRLLNGAPGLPVLLIPPFAFIGVRLKCQKSRAEMRSW